MTSRENVIKGLELLYDRLLDAAKRDAIAILDALMVDCCLFVDYEVAD